MSSSPSPAAAPVDVDAVAAAVAACPSVAHLSGGGLAGQVATYLPGRRVEGVRVTDDAVEVHIATRWDVPIPLAASEVRTAVAPLAGGRPITVNVDDVDDPQAAIPETTGGAPIAVEAVPMGATGTAPASPPGAGTATPPDAVPSPS